MKSVVVVVIVVALTIPIATAVYRQTHVAAEAEARARIVAGLDVDEAAVRAKVDAARSARAKAQIEASVLDDQVKALTQAIAELERASSAAEANDAPADVDAGPGSVGVDAGTAVNAPAEERVDGGAASAPP